MSYCTVNNQKSIIYFTVVYANGCYVFRETNETHKCSFWVNTELLHVTPSAANR